ncbi:MAG: hypothetical protein CSB33_00020 [Desulfobacterales bacterium]|nr:MAG: hypothetical protein CSB33_00020 [Desulfobacterales bacterium]
MVFIWRKKYPPVQAANRTGTGACPYIVSHKNSAIFFFLLSKEMPARVICSLQKISGCRIVY